MPPGNYIQRSLEPVIRRAAADFPSVVLTGPRQAGKTTLLKHLFGDSCGYVSLEPPDVRLAATEDPRGLLRAFPPPVILDEVQYAPGLLPYIKEGIDSDRGRSGQYLLTGSQNLLMMEHVTESLAGRVAVLRLLPLSLRELAGAPQRPLPWEYGDTLPQSLEAEGRDLWSSFLQGGYPELAASAGRDLALWHASYVQTYLERDVRSLRQVGDLSQFQSFLRALAARSAQLLNLTELARDIGVAVNSVKAWLSVLEATYQVVLLRPYFANIGKRLVKTPKVYFTDVGTLCYLVGLKDSGHAANGPMAGALMETAVVSEVIKTLLHRGEEPRIHFWRTATGTEVDLVVETQGRLVPIEVKRTSTPVPGFARSIKTFREDFADRVADGYVVHGGDTRLPLAPHVMAWPLGIL